MLPKEAASAGTQAVHPNTPSIRSACFRLGLSPQTDETAEGTETPRLWAGEFCGTTLPLEPVSDGPKSENSYRVRENLHDVRQPPSRPSVAFALAGFPTNPGLGVETARSRFYLHTVGPKQILLLCLGWDLKYVYIHIHRALCVYSYVFE